MFKKLYFIIMIIFGAWWGLGVSIHGGVQLGFIFAIGIWIAAILIWFIGKICKKIISKIFKK